MLLFSFKYPAYYTSIILYRPFVNRVYPIDRMIKVGLLCHISYTLCFEIFQNKL